MKEITSTQNKINTCQPSRTKQHQGTTPQTVYSEDGNKSEYHIGNSRYHNIKQYISQRITCRLEYFLSLIKNDIRPAPLLEHGYYNTQYKHLPIRWTEQ